MDRIMLYINQFRGTLIFNQKKNAILKWLLEEVNEAANDKHDKDGLLKCVVDQILQENDIRFQINFFRWYNLHSEIGLDFEDDETYKIERFFTKY